VAVKSIIDVEINDGAFKRFSDTFQKYQDQLAKTRPAWESVSDEARETARGFERIAAALMAQNAVAHQLAKEQAAAERSATRQGRSWHNLAKDSRSFAAHVKDATTALLRWSAITGAVSGLLGAGGLFGIDRLAVSAGNQRRSSLGLGVTAGEQNAFAVNYGRVVDPNSFLSGVNQSLTDVNKRVGLYGAGLSEADIRGKDTAQVAVELLPALKKLADATPTSQLAQVLKARHLDQFIGLQDFERLKNTSASEIGGYGQQFLLDAQKLNLTKQQLHDWQDLQVQLHRAGSEIEATFIRGLAPLAPKIGSLSGSVSRLVDAFLRNPETAHWIDMVATGLDDLAKYIGTPQFSKDVNDFVTDIGRLATAIGSALHWLAGAVSPASPEAQKKAATPGTPEYKSEHSGSAGWGYSPGLGWHWFPGETNTPAPSDGVKRSAFRPGAQGGAPGISSGLRVKEAHDFFRLAGWSEAQTAGLLANIGAESEFKAGAFNPAGGGQGAMGIAQWRGPRIEQFRKLFGHDPRHGTFEEQLLFMQWELTHTEKAAGDRLRTMGRTPGGSSDIVLHDYERGNVPSAPRAAAAGQYADTFKDRSVTVKIQNNTGGNAHVSVAQLAV
jgi:hypothetical protein